MKELILEQKPNGLLLKPSVLTEEDTKDFRPSSKKFDWDEVIDFLLGLLCAGLLGASIGIMNLLLITY